MRSVLCQPDTHAHAHAYRQVDSGTQPAVQHCGQGLTLQERQGSPHGEWSGSPLPPWLGSPVNADGTQVQDAGCAHHDVQGDKDVAVNPAEFPLAHHLETNQHNGWTAEDTGSCTRAGSPGAGLLG